MTKDTGGSDGKSRGNQPPNTFRNNVLPIDKGRGATQRGWPIPDSGISVNSGAGLLVVVGVLCGLLISESDRKSPIVDSRPNAPVQASAPAPAPAAAPTPAAAPAKPSPAVRADAASPDGAAGTKHPAAVASTRTAAYTPAKFKATHKKAFGGCTGQLELTSTGLHFHCPKSELDFPIDEIASAHKDGVVLKSGEKYHFAIANRSKDQAEAIFITWLSRVQPASQQNGAF